MIIELKAERDDLRKQLGEGTSKVMETESNKRDIEQREAVLRATSRQLEDTLKQSMADHNQREERLRSELNAMQKRWQEAILAREQLASELTQVTSPLLKQITSLQEQMRVKHEGFMHIEASLNEKIMKLESSLETAEHRKALGEEEGMLLKQQYLSVSGQLKDMVEKLSQCESTVDKLKRLEREYIEDKKTLESKLAYETAQNKSGQQALKELEMKHKIEVTEWEEKLNALRNSNNIEIARLKAEVSQLQEQMKAERSANSNSSNNRKKGGYRGGGNNVEEGNGREGGALRGEGSYSGQLEINPALPAMLPSKSSSALCFTIISCLPCAC
ncbi:hypothetical protein EON65_26725 [archaeon]|nr:MAG: hypothetical protein EON65_26725 [archaeon]